MRKSSLCLMALALLCHTLLSAQVLFESTFGSPAGTEEATDGKPLPNNKYINLANTLSFGSSQILLTRLNASGAVEMFSTIREEGFSYFGESIELNFNEAGTHTGYFIAGSRQSGSGLHQLILINTDLDGSPVWTKFLINTDFGMVDETGVAIERQSNGEVVVVGRSQSFGSGISKIIIARFNSDGDLIWCFRYGSDQGVSFEPAEACNGFRPSPNPRVPPEPVIAVTGKYTALGSTDNHTFLFLVNAVDGTELLRKTYNSDEQVDEGLDIVYKPAVNEFDVAQYMIVGSAGLGHPAMWVVRSNATTGEGSGSIYIVGLINSAFIGRGVTRSLHKSGSRAVITGILLGLTDEENPFYSRVFAMELPFSEAAEPTWVHYYEGSDPIGKVSESISGIAETPTAPGGYLITCGGRLSGSDFFDQHAIRTDLFGTTGLSDCPVVPFVTRAASGLTTGLKGNTRTAAEAWNIAFSTDTTWIYVQQQCGSIPISGGGATRPLVENKTPAPASSGLNVFPNPVNGSEPVNLALLMAKQEFVTVTVFDVTGKQIWSYRRILDSGYQEIALPANEWINGFYLVRFQSATLNKTTKLVVNR